MIENTRATATAPYGTKVRLCNNGSINEQNGIWTNVNLVYRYGNHRPLERLDNGY